MPVFVPEAVPQPVAISLSDKAVLSCAVVNEPRAVILLHTEAVIAPVSAALCNRGVASVYTSEVSTIAPVASCDASVKSVIVDDA